MKSLNSKVILAGNLVEGSILVQFIKNKILKLQSIGLIFVINATLTAAAIKNPHKFLELKFCKECPNANLLSFYLNVGFAFRCFLLVCQVTSSF